MSLLNRYNALCMKRFVGVLMIPLTIAAVLAPVLIVALLASSCAERPRPITVLIRAENGEITVMPPDYVPPKPKH